MCRQHSMSTCAITRLLDMPPTFSYTLTRTESADCCLQATAHLTSHARVSATKLNLQGCSSSHLESNFDTGFLTIPSHPLTQSSQSARFSPLRHLYIALRCIHTLFHRRIISLSRSSSIFRTSKQLLTSTHAVPRPYWLSRIAATLHHLSRLASSRKQD